MAVPLVVLENVSYYYPKATRPALFDVNLEIHRGEILGLLGATGAGKTTLCLALNGIVPQFYGGRFFGKVSISGMDTIEHPIHTFASQVSVVFQDPETQLVTSSVENEVAFALENLRFSRAEIRTRVDEALRAVDLEKLARKHPHELSGGQQQRLAIAAALAVRPSLIVLDEPTSQLDPVSTKEVFRLVKELNQRHGIAFVITGHASEEMAETVHRSLVLTRGRVAALGSPEDIYRDADLLAREHLRAPEVTALFAKLASHGLGPTAAPVTLSEGLNALKSFPRARQVMGSPETNEQRSGIPLMELKGVGYRYPDGSRALERIDFQLRRHDYVVVLGQNGAGKSTLLRHLLHLLKPTEGEVLIDGVPLTTYSPVELAQRIGYVPQNPDRQLFNVSVEAEVAFSLRLLPLSEEQKAERVTNALAALRLTEYRKAHPFSLSKGDRARVVIAAVLVLQPEILVFDEPTTGQDDAGSRAILELTRKLHEQGRTIVVVTHHLYLMPDYASRALVMGQGRVLLDADLRQAYHALDVLEQTRLHPTQAVVLARASNPDSRALTPVEVADSLLPAVP